MDQREMGHIADRSTRRNRYTASLSPESKMTPSSETAEKVRARIGRPVSRQEICLNQRSEARRTAASTSAFRVDRIGAGEIDFFSSLVDMQHFRAADG
jgi:hypothetical protein